METYFPDLSNCSISIIGLGYVGLPLAVQFAKIKKCLSTNKLLNRSVLGFDLDKKRIEDLENNFDKTFEITEKELSDLDCIFFSSNEECLKERDIFIITVPTPIDKNKKPDFSYLISASNIVGNAIKYRKKRTLPFIIFESTVYPGATKEICVPVLEQVSQKKLNIDFICGYSPERINPGDNKRTISNIKKVTSGSTPEGAVFIDNLYSSIISAGTHMTESIEVAEAAKVIENIQRDLNIGLVNELSLLFSKLDIKSKDVFDAACTKWNFHDFRPGLVGGHCIGIDPYYLTFQAEKYDFHPQLILSARKINDQMSYWIIQKLVKKMCNLNIPIGKSKVLIMGITFKEDCNDIRNSKVFDIIEQLKEYNVDVFIYDPVVDYKELTNIENLHFVDKVNFDDKYEAIIIAVAHNLFKKISINEWQKAVSKKTVIFDVKDILPKDIPSLTL